MNRNTWKGITFAEGYNKSFAEFKVEFEQMQDFKDIPSAELDEVLKEAHRIAIKGNGDTKRSVTESKETKGQQPEK
ncbi:MAG TPA: hypothetical protein VF677_11850 [Flavobacterium sp.]|jgi:hypothetical protein